MSERAKNILKAAGEGDTNTISHLLPDATTEELKYEAVVVHFRIMTALIAAAYTGHVDIVQMFLLSGKVHVDQKDSDDGYTALIGASDEGHVEVVQLLLQYNADINIQDKDGRTALYLASSRGYVDIVQLLLQCNVDVNVQTKEGKTALQDASMYGDVEVVKLLLHNNADINIQNEYGATALFWASSRGYVDIVQLLLQCNADVNVQTKDGYTALHGASKYGHIEVVQLLLQHNADVNVQINYGSTALYEASYYGKVDVVKLLLQHNADVNIQDQFGETALHGASSNGHVEIVKLLLQHNADINIQSNCWQTALDVAKTEEIKKLIQDYVAESSSKVGHRKQEDQLAPKAELSVTKPSSSSTVASTARQTSITANTATTDVTAAADVAFTVQDRLALDSFLQSFPTSVSLQQVMRTVAAHDHTLNLLVSKQKECPSLFWFYPKQPKLRNWLSNPAKCLFQDTLMMVVVCPVTLCTVQCGPDGVGWEVNLPKNWVKQWGPAILFSVYVLQAAALAGRVVGIPLPPVPGAKEVKEALGLTGMLNSSTQSTLSDSLSAFCDVTKEALDQTLELQKLCAGLQKGTDKALSADLPMHLVDEAYKSIHTFLTTGENAKLGKLEDQLRGRMERVMAPDGDIEWVSVEGRQAWLDKHKVLQQEHIHLPTPAVVSVSAGAGGAKSSWLVQRLHGSGMPAAVIDHCEAVLVHKSGYYTEKAFSQDQRITHQYLEGLGLAPSGVVAHIVTLRSELYAEYMAAHTPPRTPSPMPTEGDHVYTEQDKTAMLQMQKTVDTLTSEHNKMRALLQQQSSTGGPLRGGKGGLALQQAQCNVTNPRTRQPYTLDELAEEIHRHEKALAQCSGSIVDVASATEERFAALPAKSHTHTVSSSPNKKKGCSVM